jgi:hypothetical protein
MSKLKRPEFVPKPRRSIHIWKMKRMLELTSERNELSCEARKLLLKYESESACVDIVAEVRQLDDRIVALRSVF